jgi:type III pantothenate kinase
MLLAVDVGNTHMVLGCFRGADLVADFRLASDVRRTEDELGVLVEMLLRDVELEPDEIDAAVIASVVPSLTEPLRAILHHRLEVEPLVVEPGVKTGMPLMVEHPREVGADRIVNGIAAYERFRAVEGGPCGVIVVDFGTATTFDVISPRGEYIGGAIAPGVVIATEALFERAAKLPRVDLVLPESSIGRTTVTSMQAGILYGYAGLVDGMVERMRAELDFEPRILATGGLASTLATCADTIEDVDDYLTLEGLRLIHGRNRKMDSEGEPR